MVDRVIYQASQGKTRHTYHTTRENRHYKEGVGRRDECKQNVLDDLIFPQECESRNDRGKNNTNVLDVLKISIFGF